MAGPRASILLPSPADAAAIVTVIEDNFRTIAPEPAAARPAREVFDGRIDDRHVVITCGLEYAEQFEDVDFAGLAEFCGWPPVDVIGIELANKKDVDHLLLAQICVKLAESFSGIVDVCGRPWTLAEDIQARLEGRAVMLRKYDAGEPLGEKATQLYCDVAFLRSWKNHPAFRMA